MGTTPTWLGILHPHGNGSRRLRMAAERTLSAAVPDGRSARYLRLRMAAAHAACGSGCLGHRAPSWVPRTATLTEQGQARPPGGT